MIDASRRGVLKAGIILALRGGLGSRDAAAQDDRASVRPEEGDLLVKFGDASKTPLTPGDISVGAAQTMAWAMEPGSRTVRSGSRLNQILLLRLPPQRRKVERRWIELVQHSTEGMTIGEA